MKSRLIRILLLVCIAAMSLPAGFEVEALQSGRPVLVISVDGLDHRYLRDCDKLGLKIPTLRKLMREGEWTDGVIGVFPTVTWPSHTSIISGVTPAVHGIRGNRRPRDEGGDYYWDASLLKVKTLWHATRASGRKSAAITWPVTVNAEIDFNLPEYFQRRNGGGMDLQSIESKATPGLVEKISRVWPSFAQEWMNDRTRALATRYLLKYEKPDLILLHLVDLDAEAHHNGPFSREANAILEYTDELISEMISDMPPNTVVVIGSDHGFERADKVVDVNAALAVEGIKGRVTQSSGYLTTDSADVANWLELPANATKYGIGRQIPAEELAAIAPRLLEDGRAIRAAYEPAPHHLFGSGKNHEIFSAPAETGVHGLWPTRTDYRSSLIIWGKGIRAARRPETSMLSIAARLAELMRLEFRPGTL